MEMYAVTEDNFDLKKAVTEGKICPQGGMDADVWGLSSGLEIRMHQAFEDASVPEEMLLFFWDYANARPYMVRKVEPKGDSVFLEPDNTLLFQMQLLQLDSMRVGIAFRQKENYFCGYVRNMTAKKEELDLVDRSICKLVSMNRAAFVAYWTEGGILSVMFRDEKKFDDEFYRMKLCGYQWEDTRLTAYLEAPLMSGDAKLTMQSVSTKTVCRDVAISMERAGNTGLKTVWKMTVDFSGMDSDDSDGYRLLCELNGHSFRVVWDCDVDKDNLCRVALQSGEEMDVCVIRGINDQFILKTGKVYPVMLSIVTAVYNTAPFLAEMIYSVLSQRMSKLQDYCNDYRHDYFQNILEFILVDDGSTDGSGDILDNYARISDKVRVIHKENGGVSSARNAGIEVARGKYITFPDADDKLSENYIEEALLFFEAHQDDISVVKLPMTFFGAVNSAHWSNYQFTKDNRIVNPLVEPNIAFHNVSSSFFRYEDIRDRKFDTSITIGEDMLFVNEVIMNSKSKNQEYMMVGLVGKACYYYRKRTSGESSAMDKNKYEENSYHVVLREVFMKILLEAKDIYGYIPKWVQYSVMGQLQWRFAADDKGEAAKKALGEEKFREYKELAFSILRYIDDDVIVAQRKIWAEHYYFLLAKKYNQQPELIKGKDDVWFVFNGTRIGASFGKCYVKIEFLKIKGNVLHLEGYSMNFMPDAELLIYVNGESVKYQAVRRDINKYIFDEVVFHATTFSADILLERKEEKYEVEFRGKIEGKEINKLEIRYAKTMPLAISYKKSFYMQDDWAVRKEERFLVIYNIIAAVAANIDFEQEFEDEINSFPHKNVVSDVLKLRRQALVYLAGKDVQKKIWLLSDRVNAANDNGEALFRYLNDIKDPSVEAYYIIDSNSNDYERMKEYGNVVAHGSRQHMLLQMIADFIVSSAGDEEVINPWHQNLAKSEVIRDFLSKPEFIFLQHGITKDDISGWLNRYNKNITGFVCAAHREAQSILDYDYYYKEENVWLTGFPRHDRLYNNEKKYVTIMPTWRKWLTDGKNGNKPVKEFVHSDYYKFFNGLINCNRLLIAAEKYGYSICFMPHPSVQQVLNLFEKDRRVNFFASEKPYNEIYAESNLVVTDYSSACMDFALLEKPVIYCQFDEKQFFENHTLKHGYFDYVKDGFGEVTYDMDSLVDVMISYMKNDCRVREPYKSRMSQFFAFHDHGNCERVYRKIKDL